MVTQDHTRSIPCTNCTGTEGTLQRVSWRGAQVHSWEVTIGSGRCGHLNIQVRERYYSTRYSLCLDSHSVSQPDSLANKTWTRRVVSSGHRRRNVFSDRCDRHRTGVLANEACDRKRTAVGIVGHGWSCQINDVPKDKKKRRKGG